MKKKNIYALAFLASLLIITGFSRRLSNSAETKEKAPFAFETEVFAKGFESAWSMAWLPNGDMLVADKPGKLWKIAKGSKEKTEIKGIPAVSTKGQGGLFDVELHPNYASTGWIYISYAGPGEGGANTVIIRGKLSGNELTSQETIFKAGLLTEKGQHFGARMAFDKDGYLFFSVGERGEMENAQTLTNDCGKIHRIFDDGRVPEDNPYVRIPDAKTTIWSYGHRNPQGLKFHPTTGELFEHEHGPRGGDEVNIVRKAKNYGWPRITYGIDYDGSIISNDKAKDGMEQPIHYWVPSIAPCGMDFVTSDKYPEWKGNLFVGALAGQTLARLEIKDSKVLKEERLLNGMGRIRDVAQGPDGYLYVSTEGPGQIIRLMPK
ncbi:PQQ-dependent sugar dehydrogenase [uncultured Imperialibacter sp.]|uniref:PQQ-dependent sugar dehydrogenase n=1 Tax=uncultured Imperialibacter sp. TaxID=1672639 RepID=UPI0030DB9F68|tara:strand:+ start:1203 stop:2333 length:1131 start_codon:yes stop_codon:yes gene_type:complete